MFLLYALPAILFLSIAMAPFQVPDELNHALRADQISLGTVVPERIEGTVHRALVEYGRPFQKIWFHPEVKLNVEIARRMGDLRWSPALQRENFQNTVQYGPVLYLPQAFGLWFGRTVGSSVAQTLVIARIVNGLVCCFAGFVALSLCRRGRALMFTTLLLPMTLSQLASTSQDALIIALSHVVIGLASGVLTEGREARLGELSAFAAIVAATTIARPSQIALALMAPAFFARRDRGWRSKAVVTASAIVVIGGWMILLRWLMPPPADEWDPHGQFVYLLTNPLALPMVILNTFAERGWWLVETVIGRIGWLDTIMPHAHVVAACVVLIVAMLVPGSDGARGKSALLAAATVVALTASTFFALYITWNPVAHPIVDGVQGRYLLPVLPLLAWLVPRWGPSADGVLASVWLPLLLFPVVSLGLLPGVIMERYYGSWSVMNESLRALLLPG